MRTHRLDAAPETVHWGFFDASLKPLVTIEPGDEVVISTVSGPPEAMPKPQSGMIVPPALAAIHARVPQKLGPHMMTGPVAVRGAKAGQVLEVRIKAIELHYDWGYNAIRPLAGALPDDFGRTRIIHIPLDRSRMIGQLPWGLELPLKPFFGVMVVAPPPAWGAIGSLPPRRNGGNMDNKELVAGTTLYLPIHVDGALFSVGDGHGVQGDGEVCVITMAFDPDLDDAVVIALRDMIKFISARTGLSREDAYTLCSLAADLRVTQVVNGSKGVHIMLEKKYVESKGQSH
jgi:acetamidase/formamidase